MATKTVTVGSSVGLHARPAALIAEKASALGGGVTLGKPGAPGVDATSALMIMTLGAKLGAEIEVSGGEESTVEAIAAMVEQDLDA